MNQNELDRAREALKNAILYQKADKIASLRQALAAELSTEQINDFLKAAEEWRDQCFAIAENAITLAKLGKTRDSLEFDALKTKAKELGGNALAYLYQKFDQAVVEHNDEISAKENQNGPEEGPKSKKFLLGEITRLSTWGKRGRDQLNACMDAIRKFYPQALAEAERRKARGERLVQYKTQAVHLNQEKLSELMSKMEKEGFTTYEISIIRKMKDKIELSRKIKKSAKVSSSVSTKPELKFS